MQADFESHAREVTARYAIRLGLVVIAAALAWWPLDFVLFDDPRVLRGFAVWRVGAVFFTAATLLVLRLAGPSSRRVYPVVIAGTCLDLVAVGYGGSISGELAPRYLGALPFVCVATIVLTVPLGLRIAATLLAAAAFTGPFLLGTASKAVGDVLASHSAVAAFGVLMSIVFGDAHYRLVRKNYAQQVALNQRSRELEELDRLKNDFFANVSHELRTPLTLILAMLRELHRGPDDAALVETAERNAARLLVLIDELLELARFTRGHAEPQRRSVDVARLVREVSAAFRPSEGAGLSVLGCDAPVLAEVDPRQLRTAVHNLLANAHKFTEPASRAVAVRVATVDDRVEIAVEDNGIGIPSGAHERVFERFAQVDPGRARARGGAGIGLALVRDIAEAHGGEVSLTSDLGRGSTFTLSLPRGTIGEPDRASYDEDELAELRRRANAAPVALPQAGGAPNGSATILVAEDDPELRSYLERLLRPQYQVRAVGRGDEALAAAAEAPPDLIVTDMMMPGATGYEVARALRACPTTRRVPVLFLTARVGRLARSEAFEAGADDFVSKPFEPEELLARVTNLLALRASERALAASNERLEARVAERTAELRRLAVHLEQSQEDERRRLARDLHDETGQLLTGLRMELDLARQAREAHALAASLERMNGMLDQAFEATRAVVSALRPRVLDDLGLGAAVEWYVAHFAERSGLACEAILKPRELVVPADASTAVFRILQEALTNARRHAQARAIRVRLTARGGWLELEVVDDGRGLNPTALRTGHGILGMRERARARGGSLEIESVPEGGTRVRLSLPVGTSGDAIVGTVGVGAMGEELKS